MTAATTPAAPKTSAFAQLKSLGQKKPVADSPLLTAQQQDPALAGAKRDKTTVLLGFDPKFAERAREAAELKEALDAAAGEFEILQAEVRDYGKGKRELYNDAFKADVTTVKVPYEVQTPAGPEKRHVSVICSSKYSIQKEVILHKDTMGESWDKLFVETKTKVLRPNAEELIRGVFSEMGLKDDELETAMGQLFEEQVKIAASDKYEQEAKKTPVAVQTILGQMVTKASPGLKF